ncbi:zinc knuckle, partial [Ostertagia ostertagi]
MSGPNTLRYQKSLLTRYKNTLHRVISENGPALASENALKPLVEAITAIRESANLLATTLNGFVQTLDQLAGPTTEDQQKANQGYIDETLDALEEAEELLIRMEAKKAGLQSITSEVGVSEENYAAALELLHSKYGDKAKLVRNLQRRMETASAKNNQISEQRNLLEYLISLTAQLRQQGVTLKGSFISQKILAKFNVDLQRRLLKQRVSQDYDEDSWTVEDILNGLDVLIKTEERVAEMIQENDPCRQRFSRATESKFSKSESRAQCVYCGAHDHNALRCPKVTTAEDRKEFMKQKKLCMNCARRNHFLRECTGTGCAKCGGEKHHYSLCPKRLQELKGTPAGANSQRNSSTAPLSKQGRGRSGKHPTRVSAQLTESAEPEEILQAATSHSGETPNGGELSQVYLLTGQARVENAKTGKSQMVQILLDTGADRSFIQERLAEKLDLPVVNSIELSVHTFGAKTPRKKKYDVTTLKIWDRQNNPLDLVLCKADVISGKGKQLALSAEDMKQLKSEGIQLPRSGSIIKPEILLGCDQLWALLEFPGKQHRLPSGLHAIPSRLGYLITGKAWKNSQNAQNET